MSDFTIEVTLENFKAISKPVTFELKPITLLFGPNNSGKSTIIQSLLYAHEIFENYNLDPHETTLGGQTVNLGGFKNLVHNHNLNLPIRMRFEVKNYPFKRSGAEQFANRMAKNMGDPLLELEFLGNVFKSFWIEIVIRTREKLNDQEVSKYPKDQAIFMYQVAINNEIIVSFDVEKGKYLLNMNFIHDISNEIDEFYGIGIQSIFVDRFRKILSQKGYIDESANEFSQFIENECDLGFVFPPKNHRVSISCDCLQDDYWTDYEFSEVIEPFEDLLTALIVHPRDIVGERLKEMRYIGPLRKVPSRSYKKPLLPSESRWANGLAAWDVLLSAELSLIEKTNDWLLSKHRFNIGYELIVKHYKELDVHSEVMLSLEQSTFPFNKTKLKKYIDNLPIKSRLFFRELNRNVELTAQDLGVGISQMLPVLIGALVTRGLMAIEQPELHIHPALQLVLGDLFITQAKESGTFFLVETHSEHLLLRLLRRIGETHENNLPVGITGITKKDIAIYNVEREDNKVILRKLEVTDDGEADHKWPKGFFGERLEELL